MGSAAQRASLPTILIVEDEFLPRAMLSDHLQENVSLIGGSSATYRVSVWISQLGFGAWANELLGNNRLWVARRFDPAVTTILGIAVTMIALIRAS